jgi:uncharacterized protein with FMN-binding domain
MRMNKKIGVIVGVVAIFAVYTAILRSHNTKMVADLSSGTSTGDSSDTAGGSSTTALAGETRYKDGTYTGPSKNAFYGNVKVAVTISNGQITGVTVPVSPDSDPNSQDINSQALPVLKQEAVKSQGTKVDAVSGATMTSQAFAQSLKAALSQAKA